MLFKVIMEYTHNSNDVKYTAFYYTNGRFYNRSFIHNVPHTVQAFVLHSKLTSLHVGKDTDTLTLESEYMKFPYYAPYITHLYENGDYIAFAQEPNYKDVVIVRRNDHYTEYYLDEHSEAWKSVSVVL